MRVVLDGEPLRPPLTGIGRYTLELARALEAGQRLEHLDLLTPHCRLVGIDCAQRTATALAHQHGVGRKVARGVVRRGCRLLLGRKLRRADADLFHGPNYALPRLATPGVVTVHDLSHIHYPEAHPRRRVYDLRWTLPRALDRAAAVITVSEAVRGELLAQFGLPPARVHAIPNGVSAEFSPAALDPARLAPYGLRPAGYVLAVGTLEPRKNLDRLLAAHARLPATLRRSYPLAVAGAPGWRDGRLRRTLAHAVGRGEAIHLGYVPAADLPALYAGARVFAYPSRYEGFGLPVLEALASGTPVITSDRGALAEVAGDAACRVDPDDVAALHADLERLLTDDERRHQLSCHGPQRAARFTWLATAARTCDVYDTVIP